MTKAIILDESNEIQSGEFSDSIHAFFGAVEHVVGAANCAIDFKLDSRAMNDICSKVDALQRAAHQMKRLFDLENEKLTKQMNETQRKQ